MDDDGKTRAQLLDDVASLRQQLAGLHAARLDAESVIEVIREPLMVLTIDLRVISANRAFYQTFQVTPEEARDDPQALFTQVNPPDDRSLSFTETDRTPPFQLFDLRVGNPCGDVSPDDVPP